MEVLRIIGLLLLSLSILVVVHEFGHFIAARIFGMRVEKFYLFFDIKNLRLFRRKFGDTEYGVGLIPLGGYVKISGIIDESMDTSFVNAAPQPWEFRSKPVWQRMIVMVAGVTMNVILGVLIFTILKFSFGDPYIPNDAVKYGIYVPEGGLAEKIGLRNGDKILSANGKKIERFSDSYEGSVFFERDPYYLVLRVNDTVRIDIPADFLNELQKNLESKEELFSTRLDTRVGDVVKNSPAEKGGIQKGDIVMEIAGTDVYYFDEMRKVLQPHKNEIIEVKLLREDKDKKDTLLKSISLDKSGNLGIFADISAFKTEFRKYSLLASFPEGVKEAYRFTTLQVKAFGKIFRGELNASQSVSGPIDIANFLNMQYKSAGWIGFWQMTAMLSVVLAFVNILPIPVLDGGHLMMLLYEAITRREPSLKFRLVTQNIGLILLVSLMAFVLLNDILKLIH